MGEGYLAFWQTKIGFQIGDFKMVHELQHWINDGLMAIFFFVIGLEVKRELVLGELRDLRRAALPIIAALGGMITPAGIYLFLQAGEPAMRGWGIPMATDIAFVVGCMAILGPRVPHGLRVLLLSLAIADDIGAILVIAIGYTSQLNFPMLLLGFAGIIIVFLASRLGVRSFLAYTILGVITWFGFYESGVHATIAGVILGLMTPATAYLDTTLIGRLTQRAAAVLSGDWESQSHRAEKLRKFQWAARESISPLEYLENLLHPWVSFIIMPIFALANAGVVFESKDFLSPVAIAVAAGLVIGKPAGIFILSWLGIKAKLASLPNGVGWITLLGGGALAGIGFTMALFIAGLALSGNLLNEAKVGVLSGSTISAVTGMILLVLTLPRRKTA
jgi:NhaA family Na+:H+ antiporter